MRIRVDLLPAGPYDGVVVLIDVLRTCTVAPILFENGLQTLRIASRLKLAQQLARQADVLLLGERKGLPLEGFNYGNSPAQLRGADMTDKSAVLVSENAPKVLPQLGGATQVLLASLYNAEAAAQRALALADETIYLVCCGLWGQEDLDDSLAAGLLAARLSALAPEAELGGAARLTLALLGSFPDPLGALWGSSAGHYLRKLNLTDDLAVASLLNQTSHVPRLTDFESNEYGSLYTFASER